MPGPSPARCGSVRVGTSGWLPARWAGARRSVQPQQLVPLAQRLRTIEITRSFGATQRPSAYRAWAAATPDDFVFAVKARRYITHVKKLADASPALANFFASGVLALGPKLGPVLWQLPDNLAFDPARLDTFLNQLPHSTLAAARLAAECADRMTDRAWIVTDADRPLRHAVEVRHPSFATAEFVELLRAHGVALVVAESAGRRPYLEDLTAGHVYVRLHGDTRLYRSAYTFPALDAWASRIGAWASGQVPHSEHTVAPRAEPRPRDVYVYVNTGLKRRAAHDALALARRVGTAGRPG